MARSKQLTWSELRVGLFVLVGLMILAVGIFYVTGAGVWGPKYRLNTFLPEVAGLAQGAPVDLDGVQIGNVERISVVPRQHGKPRTRCTTSRSVCASTGNSRTIFSPIPRPL